MDKMKMESTDMTAQNIEKIGALFPNYITETVDDSGKPKKAVNFDLLRQMLSDEVVDGDEAYEFTWVGKKAAIVEANRPIRKTLRPCVEESKNWDTTENLYIEGDNLEVLKLLLFKNSDTNGRFRSNWCLMIYSRLLLAKNKLVFTAEKGNNRIREKVEKADSPSKINVDEIFKMLSPDTRVKVI